MGNFFEFCASARVGLIGVGVSFTVIGSSVIGTKIATAEFLWTSAEWGNTCLNNK